MRTSLRWMGLAAVLAGALAGCGFDGGRGSSGFEIRENAIIQQVLDTQRCVSGQRLTFCPADRRDAGPTTPTPTATAPTAGPTATRTPDPLPRVDTQVANGASIACTRPHAGAPCSLTFSFAGIGFPDGAAFRVASRLRTPDGAWSLAAVPMPSGDGTLDTAVVLEVPAELDEASLQFAVLVFLTPPAVVPARFDTLAQSGADFGFVTPVFALEIITIGPPPTATLTAMPTSTGPPASVSPTPAAPTPTATTAVPAGGPVITYFGVTRADSVSLAPSAFDGSGRPIYVRPFGHGLSLVVEGRPGASHRPIGASAYTPGEAPALQLILSRPLGDGSPLVCDREPPVIGGVPATVPFAFAGGAALVDAMNDLGCRADDGTGSAQARSSSNACTLDLSGEYRFVDLSSSTQFCLPIAAQWGFPPGDTLVAARLRDVGGELGPVREIVVRNAATSVPSPSSIVATHTATAPPIHSPTIGPPTPSPTRTSTAPTRTPTPTAVPGIGPDITYFGVARADNRPLLPAGTDDGGRPIFTSRNGGGISLVVEAAPGSGRRPVGLDAYSAAGLPDLQLIVSRPLGNGSAVVCDDQPPFIGGVPATTPLRFSDAATVVGAVNDLGCRVDDGQGSPRGRSPNNACTVNAGAEYVFLHSTSTTQYCLPIAAAWAFPRGDTVVAARVRDGGGQLGAVREIVVRVAR